MQRMKKYLSWILALVMLFSCIPVTALATDATRSTEGVAQNTTTNKVYPSVLMALLECAEGQTIVMLQDSAETMISIYEDMTLDLNGHTLSASYVTSYGTIIDSSADNSGLLEVPAEHIMIREKNKQVPVRDGSGYRFVQVQRIDTAYVAEEKMFAFQVRFEPEMLELMKRSQDDTDVSIQVKVSWKEANGYRSQNFIYIDEFVQTYLNSYNSSIDWYGEMFTLVLDSTDEFQDLTFAAVVVSKTGVRLSSDDPIAADDEIYSGSAAIKKGGLVYGALANDVTIGDTDGVNAIVPSNVKVAADAEELVLSVKKAETGSEIVLGDGESAQSLDVHIAGVAADNKVPIIVNLGPVLEKGLSETQLKLYHTENGKAVLMTRVASVDDFAIHNQYTYNPETGEVSIYVASFSVFSAVASSADKWDGTADTSWYNDADTEFTLITAEQFAGFRDLVDGGNTFAGKTVKLGVDIDLDKKLFDPIGFDYVHLGGKAFMGVFDGQGHTIYNLYQNGWELDPHPGVYDVYSYSTAGGGLFASVKDATIKNLAVCGANIVFECVDIGIVVGYAQGVCHFENIVVTNSTIANYNRATGAVVGEVCEGPHGTDITKGYSHTFKDITVDSSVTVSSLWGSFDTLCGGVIGGKWGDATVLMQDITVACKLDVFSDVTAAYQWYAYRRCGMLIGHTEQNSPKKALNAAAPFLTCENVKVYYGDWVNYTYYEFDDQDSDTGRRYPWVRAEAGLNNGAFSNPRYGVPAYNGVKVTENSELLKKASDYTPIVFGQLYGGGQGVYGCSEHDGVTVYNKTAKIVYIKNDQKGENLKLQYWYKHGDNIWSTIIDGIDMSTMLQNGVYRIELPTYVYAFKIVGDNVETEEVLVADVGENETYNLNGKHVSHKYENGKCDVCGEEAKAPIVIWEDSFEVGETFETVGTKDTPTTSQNKNEKPWNNAAPIDKEFYVLDIQKGVDGTTINDVWVSGDIDGAYDGEDCIKLDANGQGGRLYLRYDLGKAARAGKINLVDGKKYIVSVWAKIETENSTFQLMIKNTGDASNPKMSVNSKNVGVNQWVQLFLPFTYSEKKDGKTLNCEIDLEMLSTGTYYVDKLQIFEKQDATGVTLDATADVDLGQSIQLTPSLDPVTAMEKITYTWESLNPEIATVDANGKVTGIDEGEAIIRVTATKWEYDFTGRVWNMSDTKWSAECVVTVTAKAPIVVWEDSFEVGKTFNTAGANGQVVSKDGEDNWFGAAPNNASVWFTDLYKNNGGTGTVTGGVGGAFDGDSCIKLEADNEIVYMAYNLQYLTGEDKPVLEDGQYYVLSVWVKYDADTTFTSLLQIKNTTAAVEDGNVNPRVSGGKNLIEWTKLEVPFLYTDANTNLVINLNMQGKETDRGAVYFDLLQITKMRDASGIVLDEENVELEQGEQTQLNVSLDNPAATTKVTYTWSSNNTSVATVDKNGVVIAVGEGTATITATARVYEYDFVNRKWNATNTYWTAEATVTVPGA